MNSKLKTAYNLSILIVILSSVTSIGGLLIDNLYQDNTFVKSAWHGNDLVTLFVAVPVLIATLIFSKRGSHKAQLIWLGLLDYMLYNFAFYLFGASFNTFFLLYVALLALSIYAMIFVMIGIDSNQIGAQFTRKTPVKIIGGYMLFVAIGLSIVYIAQSVLFIVNDKIPAIVEKSGHPTSIIFALDLTLLIPALVLGAILIFKRQPWGYILATLTSIKGAVYTLVLTMGSLFAVNAGFSEASAELPLWITLTVAGSIVSVLLLVNMKSKGCK
ncbi:MAG: hypothetical protein K0R71_1079 [Bacillales bacterium]|jgi:hypothetical protein|nr:hypothetical protein [Bacillales bacterium]